MRRWIVAGTAALLGGTAVAVAADDAADVAVRVADAARKPLKDVPVHVGVKAWPGGRFAFANRDGKTDGKGRATFDGVIPGGTRYGVYVSVASPGWTLTSEYFWSGKPAPMPPSELTVARAHPLKLRFVGDDGRPVKDVLAAPAMRADAAGARHEAYGGPDEKIAAKSGADGVVEMDYFLPGEWTAVSVRFPERGWETRNVLVPRADAKERAATVDVPSKAPVTPDRELTAGGDAKKRYFLTGPKAGDVEPEAGWGVVLVLPGGDGSDGFRKWVSERYDTWIDAGFVWAELVAPKWVADPQIIWPIQPSAADGRTFGTEEFVAAVVEDVAQQVKLDRKRVFTVSWSSSGPACWRIASLKDSPVTGSLIAMSVFHAQSVEPLSNAKGRPFFLLHSPEDDRCPIALAEKGRDALKKAGAKVEWATYEGGHGWGGESEDLARKALHWLTTQAAR